MELKSVPVFDQGSHLSTAEKRRGRRKIGNGEDK